MLYTRANITHLLCDPGALQTPETSIITAYAQVETPVTRTGARVAGTASSSAVGTAARVTGTAARVASDGCSGRVGIRRSAAGGFGKGICVATHDLAVRGGNTLARATGERNDAKYAFV